MKENHAYLFIAYTLAHFPESRFVWLVRDPRDMALCQRQTILPGGVQKAAPVWKENQGETLKVYGYRSAWSASPSDPCVAGFATGLRSPNRCRKAGRSG